MVKKYRAFICMDKLAEISLGHSSFTSKIAGSILSHVKTMLKLCRESWVVSRYSGFLPQGKLTGWFRCEAVNLVRDKERIIAIIAITKMIYKIVLSTNVSSLT